jgi:hypothetical protein
MASIYPQTTSPKTALMSALDPNTQTAGNAGVFDPTAAVSAPAVAAADPYANLAPSIAAVYKQHNASDNGQGSGFQDFAYWNNHPDQAARLNADLSGTGPDQPGPKDSGVSLGSGRGMPTMGGNMPMMGLSTGLNPLLQGSGTSNIQNALSNLQGGTGIGTQGYLQSLIAALGGQ